MNDPKSCAPFYCFELDDRVNPGNYKIAAIKAEYDISLIYEWVGRFYKTGDDDEEFNEYYKKAYESKEIIIAEDEFQEYSSNLWIEKKLFNQVNGLLEEFSVDFSAGTICLLLLIVQYWDRQNLMEEQESEIIDSRFEYLKFYHAILDHINGDLDANKILLMNGNKEKAKFEFSKGLCEELIKQINPSFLPNSSNHYSEYNWYKDKIKHNSLSKGQSQKNRRDLRFSVICKFDNLFKNCFTKDRERFFFINQLLGCIKYMGHDLVARNCNNWGLEKANAIRKIEKLLEDRLQV